MLVERRASLKRDGGFHPPPQNRKIEISQNLQNIVNPLSVPSHVDVGEPASGASEKNPGRFHVRSGIGSLFEMVRV